MRHSRARLRAPALRGLRARIVGRLNIHLHALVRDGVYCTGGEGAPVFNKASAPSHAQLQALLDKIINRIMKLLTY